MATENSLQRLAQLVNSGKSFPALKVVRSQYENAAVLSKLIKDERRQGFKPTDSESYYNLNVAEFQNIANTISRRMHDADNIMRLFPDLELAAQILISSILSPKDMVNSEILYALKESIFPPDIANSLLSELKLDIEDFYKLQATLPDILREVLFKSGAYIKAVLPESAVDEIINGGLSASTEAFREILERPSLGILGPFSTKESSTGLSMESLVNFRPDGVFAEPIQLRINKNKVTEPFKHLVEVSDNYKYLKLHKALLRHRSQQVKSVISTESAKTTYTDREIESLFFRKPQVKDKPFVRVSTKDQTARHSLGRPLEMKIPTEATIPVFVPGNPKEHIGYFIILDEEGNPVTYGSSREALSNMQSALNDPNNSITSVLTQKAHNNLLGISGMGLNLTDKAQVYMGIIEADLINRLKNGIYGCKLEIGRKQEVYQIMMARTLSNQYTRIVYIPVELITYFAFNYHENGTGQSLYDDLGILTSLRAILLFSKVMNMAKNSISVTRCNMVLDEDDPDPRKTIETAVNEVMRMRQQYFPLGINNPLDLVDWVQRLGIEFTFEGHPGIPNTKFEFESKNMQHEMPDSDLDELLRKQTIMALGLSPETVDNGFNSEFATTIVSNNILMSKRVLQYQQLLNPQLTDYVAKIITNDTSVRSRLITILEPKLGEIDKYIDTAERKLLDEDKSKFMEYMIDKLASYLELSLPKPDITSLENLKEAFDAYASALEDGLNQWASSDFVTQELAGELSSSVDAIKAALKAHYLRQWMADNNYLPELADIVGTTEDEKPLLDLYQLSKDHMEGIMRTSAKFIASLKPAITATDKDLQNMGAEGEGPIDTSSSTSSSDSDEGEESDTGSVDMDSDDDFANMGSGDIGLDDVT